ncbi:hypothetical protein GOV04_03345 [Candidatus Woesearchaeota archaeon]|nr:hypothetical protein [Candidatus Woesearchaeota archaeon]
MPASLVLELKRLAKNNHYMDLSELLRSISRKKYLQQKEPIAAELQQIRHDLTSKVKNEQMRKQRDLLLNLKELLGELNDE